MYIPWLTSVCGGSYISIYIYILVMGFIIQLITGEPQLIVLWSPEANLRDGSCHPDRADVHPNRTVPALGSLRGLRRFTAVSLANYSWLLASGRQFGWPAVQWLEPWVGAWSPGDSLDHPLVEGSWEAIFRVTDDFYSIKGGVRLYIT